MRVPRAGKRESWDSKTWRASSIRWECSGSSSAAAVAAMFNGLIVVRLPSVDMFPARDAGLVPASADKRPRSCSLTANVELYVRSMGGAVRSGSW